MKKFMEGIMQWKTYACLMFTAVTVIYTLIQIFFGNKSIDPMIIISILIVSALGSLIQYVAFTEVVFKNIKYAVRLIIFMIPFFMLILGNALLFDWLPDGTNPGYLVTFAVIFIIVFIGMTIGFEIYYRITEKKYEGLIGQYRQNHVK